jgi:hypothetical protein
MNPKRALDGLPRLLAGVKTNRWGEFFHPGSWSSFKEWADDAKKTTNPQKARGVLYYVYQPLYDALISGEMPLSHRNEAARALAQVVETGVDYLTGFYLGKPDTRLVQKLGKDLGPRLAELPYSSKFRNVDRNGITSKDIHLFLLNFANHFSKSKTRVPNFVIGCACGASEMAMPLAGLLGCQVGFMRRSHRRGDDLPKTIKEHQALLKKMRGKTVICIEDYVCTGQSLKRVMDKAKAYGAAKVYGASVNCSGGSLRQVASERKFHLFEE